MSANRGKDSKPELLLRRALRSAGNRGYRLHYKIALPSEVHPSSLIPHPSSESSPPYEGGVDPDERQRVGRRGGSLLSQRNLKLSETKNHPGGEAPPPLLGKEGSPKGRRIASVRPDIAFVGRRVAIFVHGCFWHRCPRCNYPLPKNNPEFWQAKFDRNVTRDAHKKNRPHPPRLEGHHRLGM